MRDELGRRLVHASGSVLPLAVVAEVLTYRQFQFVALAGSLLVVVLEGIRLSGRPGPFDPLFDRLTREYEQENVAGYALYVLSSTLVAFVFGPPVALPAILMLTVGDPISGYLGSGSLQKGTTVLAVMFGVCALIAVSFVGLVPAVLGALGATLADGVKPVVRGYVVDDNLTIPPTGAVGVSAGLWLVTQVPALAG